MKCGVKRGLKDRLQSRARIHYRSSSSLYYHSHVCLHGDTQHGGVMSDRKTLEEKVISNKRLRIN